MIKQERGRRRDRRSRWLRQSNLAIEESRGTTSAEGDAGNPWWNLLSASGRAVIDGHHQPAWVSASERTPFRPRVVPRRENRPRSLPPPGALSISYPTDNHLSDLAAAEGKALRVSFRSSGMCPFTSAGPPPPPKKSKLLRSFLYRR